MRKVIVVIGYVEVLTTVRSLQLADEGHARDLARDLLDAVRDQNDEDLYYALSEAKSGMILDIANREAESTRAEEAILRWGNLHHWSW